MKISLFVNEISYQPELTDPDMTLLFFLRNVLGLTAAKNGCGEGHCGSCTVLIDGRVKRSCLIKMRDLDGKHIMTPEALSKKERIHCIIYAFITAGAVQCGFCTPGFIMTAKALLERNPGPSEQEIKKAFVGNICRCTGYVKIINAVKRSAALMQEGRTWIQRSEVYPDTVRPFGSPVPRVDALAKAAGELKFADDLFFENMLYTKVLRSEYPHAEILSVDISEAKNMEGVAAVLTAKDIPGENRFGPIVKDQPVLAENRVRYIGDAIAAVYAESESIALGAVSKIQVQYRPLPVVTELEDALKEDALLLHDNGKKSNVFSRMESGRGDVEQGFAEADLILEDDLFTQFVEHAYLEPESGVAVPEEDGRITVYVGSQGPEMDIGEIAPVLAMTPEKIHIAHMPMGGGFGGKEDVSVQIMVALGALKTGRPVKYTFTRRESIKTSGKRNSQRLHYKIGVKKDGSITAVKTDIDARGGAYASVEEAVILRSVSFAAGPYTIPNADIQARAVYTNNIPTCAMRGFGNPPVTFAMETQLNRLAEKLNLDPFEIRLKNILVEGLPTVTGERIRYSVGAKACLLAVREALAKTKLPEPAEGWKRGTGLAMSYKNVGLGIGMDDSAGARGEIIADGKLLLSIGSVDMGQGSDTAMAQIASETIGWPYSRIVVQSADTERDPLAGMTTASRQTFVSGNAVLKMAEKLKEKMYTYLADEFKLDPDNIEIKETVFYQKDSGEPLLSLEAFSEKLQRNGVSISAEYRYTAPDTYLNLKEPQGGYPAGEDRLHFAYCFAAQAVILDVDEKTGKVHVQKVIAASDTGRPVNPHAVEGQIEGGVVMGLGYALSEECKLEKGLLVSDTYGKLGVRRIGQTPAIESIIIENPHAEGPYGAKGMGELPLSTGAPAVVHAIHDALGIWITSLPVTPQKILENVKRET